MWYEQSCIQRGEEKLLDLDLVIAPHTKEPEQYVRDLRNSLLRLTRKQDGR